jgi:hypothetical protein
MAGLRLWLDKGWIWGGVASFFVALDLALFAPELTSIGAVTSVVVKVVLLALIINGARGALAFRMIDYPTTCDTRSQS